MRFEKLVLLLKISRWSKLGNAKWCQKHWILLEDFVFHVFTSNPVGVSKFIPSTVFWWNIGFWWVWGVQGCPKGYQIDAGWRNTQEVLFWWILVGSMKVSCPVLMRHRAIRYFVYFWYNLEYKRIYEIYLCIYKSHKRVMNERVGPSILSKIYKKYYKIHMKYL